MGPSRLGKSETALPKPPGASDGNRSAPPGWPLIFSTVRCAVSRADCTAVSPASRNVVENRENGLNGELIDENRDSFSQRLGGFVAISFAREARSANNGKRV